MIDQGAITLKINIKISIILTFSHFPLEKIHLKIVNEKNNKVQIILILRFLDGWAPHHSPHIDVAQVNPALSL